MIALCVITNLTSCSEDTTSDDPILLEFEHQSTEGDDGQVAPDPDDDD